MAETWTVAWRLAVRGEIGRLVVPQGFTLSIGGVLASLASREGLPGPWEAWLYVVGAAAGFGSGVLISAAQVDVQNRTPEITGMSLFNAVPVVVVPLAVVSSWWVTSVGLSALVAGFVTSFGYLALLACFLVATDVPRRRALGGDVGDKGKEPG